MAFDDVTLFELHFDGATIGTPVRDEPVEEVHVTDPERMIEDEDEMMDDATERSSPSRGRRVIGVAAVVAAAVAVRAMYRRRAGRDEGAAVAVESVDHDEPEAEPVEQ
ncbi:hypothetical protein [Halorientalis pallida]|uniref:Uncharacterized protein n=1 Tax=Halorientalis pallida TaxID=2479928 RepID=A0A498KXI1_9EURY|nr:hypothetical protein [Halorientalis pallida]RXK50330.1 hypothetical protein EAF64_07140 [Halorientalis pallida]